MEIIEGNKLIAEFMGGEYNQYSDSYLIYDPDKNFRATGRYSIGGLKYHTSWDWLMPVVEKIESIFDSFHGYFGVHISSNGCTIQGTFLRTDPDNPHYAYFNNITHETKLSATWNVVIEFIQWYNKQK